MDEIILQFHSFSRRFPLFSELQVHHLFTRLPTAHMLLVIGHKLQQHTKSLFGNKYEALYEAIYAWLLKVWFTKELHMRNQVTDSWWAYMGSHVRSMLILAMVLRFKQLRSTQSEKRTYDLSRIPAVFFWLYDMCNFYEDVLSEYAERTQKIAQNNPEFALLGTGEITEEQIKVADVG